MTGSVRTSEMDPITCLVLVGLPGAGKSTVGPLVAERLGWAFVDLDVEIERTVGRSVAEIFATDGEAAFRRLEREATHRVAVPGDHVLDHVPGDHVPDHVPGDHVPVHVAGDLVLAPGGGWMLDPANLSTLGKGARTVYLRVSPETAVSRMAAGLASRPLLATPDPLSALRGLLAAREAVYLQANHTVAAEMMSPTALADSIVALVSRSQGH